VSGSQKSSLQTSNKQKPKRSAETKNSMARQNSQAKQTFSASCEVVPKAPQNEWGFSP
jgi:hypothetical protein